MHQKNSSESCFCKAAENPADSVFRLKPAETAVGAALVDCLISIMEPVADSSTVMQKGGQDSIFIGGMGVK